VYVDDHRPKDAGPCVLNRFRVILGVYAHRVHALASVALILWALPRLARRSSLDAGLERPAHDAVRACRWR
jgi:hypothetical protein